MKKRQGNVVKVNALSYTDFQAQFISEHQLIYGTDGAYQIAFKNTRPVPNDPNIESRGSIAESMTEAELEACFDLIDRTSGSDYAASSLGWKPAAKRAEMREQDMRFLLVRARKEAGQRTTQTAPQDPARAEHQDPATSGGVEQVGSPLVKDESVLGFISFMITVEEGQDVVYIYEIHLEEALRGCGLGRHLFDVVEYIGAASGMEKAMLTVFRRNRKARAMYERVGYDVDECSPKARRLRGGVVKESEYIIMSKRLNTDSKTSDLEHGASKRRKVADEGAVLL